MNGRLMRALSGAAPLLAEGPTDADLMNDAATPGDVLYGMGPQAQRFSHQCRQRRRGRRDPEPGDLVRDPCAVRAGPRDRRRDLPLLGCAALGAVHVLIA